jgi:C-methyltransferase
MADQSSQPVELLVESQMWRLLLGSRTTQAIAVAAKLRLADLVTVASRTADELARETNSHPRSLRRLLQFLTSIGIFAEDADGKYRNTALSEGLRSDALQTFRDVAIMFGSEFHWRVQGDLYQTIITGQSACGRVLGTSVWDYLAAHPDDAAIVNAAMTSGSSVLKLYRLERLTVRFS